MQTLCGTREESFEHTFKLLCVLNEENKVPTKRSIIMLRVQDVFSQRQTKNAFGYIKTIIVVI